MYFSTYTFLPCLLNEEFWSSLLLMMYVYWHLKDKWLHEYLIIKEGKPDQWIEEAFFYLDYLILSEVFILIHDI